jgi:hypothetical protein
MHMAENQYLSISRCFSSYPTAQHINNTERERKEIERRRGQNKKFEVLTYQGWQEDCVVFPSNDGEMLLTLH